jgi:hypothetical protein
MKHEVLGVLMDPCKSGSWRLGRRLLQEHKGELELQPGLIQPL